MILICDNDISARAIGMRDKIFHAGFPCAISEISNISEYLPLKLIVTFTDVFYDVRRTPYDDVFVLAVGKGFVNSALNAKGVTYEDDVIDEILKYIFEIYKIHEKDITAFGYCFPHGIFFSKNFIEIYGNIVELTTREYMIFKYLYSHAGDNVYLTTTKIFNFCFPDNTSVSGKDNKISVHISHINKKFELACGKVAIKDKRFLGYYYAIK